MTDTQKIPVSLHDTRRRVNRALSENGEKLFKQGGTSNYYTVDTKRAVVTGSGLDLEEFGIELGALRPWETVGEAEWGCRERFHPR